MRKVKLSTTRALLLVSLFGMVAACESRERSEAKNQGLIVQIETRDSDTNRFAGSSTIQQEPKVREKAKVERWKENPPIDFRGRSFKHLSDVLKAAEQGDSIFLPRGIYTYPLAVKGFTNLHFVAKQGPAYFLVPSHEVDVLTLDSCKDIWMENLYFKHDVFYGACKDASTVKLKNCENIRFERCLLNGSGTYGLDIENSIGVEVNNCAIEHCSNHAIRIQGSKRVRFTNNYLQSTNLLAMDERTVNPMSFYTESLPNRDYVESQLRKLEQFHVVFYGNNMRFSGRYLNHQLRSKEPLKLRGTHFVEYNVVASYGRSVSQKKLSKTNRILHNNSTDTFKSFWPCKWHPGVTFMRASGQQLVNSPVLEEGIPGKNMLWLWKEKPTLNLLFPGDYFFEGLKSKNIDKTTKMVVTDQAIKPSELRFFENGKVEDIGGGMVLRKTLLAKDSCVFIVDSGRIEPGPLPETIWQSEADTHRITLGDYTCVFRTISNDAISYVLMEDEKGEKVLAYRNEGIVGEYGPYGRVTLTWVGDINRDGRPDFLCHYVAAYCSFAHLLFLSNSSADTGYEVNYYPDIKYEPCGC